MDEHVVVRFDVSDRIVLVDGRPGGRTNKRMLTETGTYTFSLQGAPDFTPPSQKIVVENTTEDEPMIVRFAKRTVGGTTGSETPDV